MTFLSFVFSNDESIPHEESLLKYKGAVDSSSHKLWKVSDDSSWLRRYIGQILFSHATIIIRWGLISLA